jgi:hypothetical protein
MMLAFVMYRQPGRVAGLGWGVDKINAETKDSVGVLVSVLGVEFIRGQLV